MCKCLISFGNIGYKDFKDIIHKRQHLFLYSKETFAQKTVTSFALIFEWEL